ncbi:MAG TPA: DUF3833 family protein [Thermoanaerobaculia bacterium]|jgi:hypothetical protein
MTRISRGRAIASLIVLLAVTGCRSMTPSQLAATTPALDPLQYFEGATRSWGVIENRRGDPMSQFRADLVGHRDGDELTIEQRFTFADDRRETRHWRIRRVAPNRYEATANDVVGVSIGEARGNTFHWSYVTAGTRAGFIDDLRYELWMYLMEDGRTLINRVTITKFGVVVARTTERFQRE